MAVLQSLLRHQAHQVRISVFRDDLHDCAVSQASKQARVVRPVLP